MRTGYQRAFLLLLIAAAAVLAAGLGLRDPWPADEPRFALIARDMAESGSWLLPNVGGVLYPDKPPLHFWLVAALYAVTGSLRFSFLFPAFAGGLLVIALVTDLGRRLWSERAGLWSGAVLLSMLQFPLQMKSGQLDGPLCAWTTLSLYGYCRHLLLGPDWRWYAVGGVAAGLGVITKGVGFLPYLVFLPLILVVRQGWPRPPGLSRDWRWILAPVLSLAVIAAWLVPMLLVTSDSADPALQAYRDNILFHQTVTRYADAWGHLKPPWYLWTNAVPWLWLPATLALPWLLPAWWRTLRRREDTALLLLAAWVVLVLLFFSLSSGKRSVYIFPAAPAFALLVGACAGELVDRQMARRAARLLPLLFGAVLIVVGMFGVRNPDQLLEQLPDLPTILKATTVIVGIGLAMILASLLPGTRRPFVGLAMSLGTLWIGLGLLLAPTIDEIRSGRQLVQAAEAALAPREELGLVGWPEQFLLQLRRPVFHFGFRRPPDEDLRDAIAWLREGPGRRVLVSSEHAQACVGDRERVELGIAHRRDWWLISSRSLAAACIDAAPPRPATLYRYVRPAATR